MRVCLRLGAEIGALHLPPQPKAEAPARAEEIHHAEEEGIEFHWLTARSRSSTTATTTCAALRCIRMELGEPDESGRRRPVPVPGSEFEFEADLVVFAIGTNANPILGQTSKLKLNKRGYIETDETWRPRCRRVRRRRHRHRRRHRDRGDGRGPQGRAQHEGLARPARHRRGLSPPRPGARGPAVRPRPGRADFARACGRA
jgi:NADPH-dependent glutamate synthase beta subunit-like oxidoreductase